MSMEEIDKLRLRVEKDPHSRLFLPLAEEYRKSGMLDEAISVILRGLEHQPGYTSARVALGRIYLEKNMINEAKGEFEAVVNAIPDNLFAHRKLADIYREQGEFEKASAEYKSVIKLNPLDEDAKQCLSEIEGSGSSEEADAFGLADLAEIPGAAEAEALPAREEAPVEEAAAAAEPAEAVDEDFEAFKSAFSVAEDEDRDAPEETVEVLEDESLEIPDEISFDDILTEAPVAAEEFSDLAETSICPEEIEVSQESADIAAADALIAGGNFYGAMETYRGMLAREPENKRVLQRVAELKTLMKLMGKGNEVLIAKLESFLDAVKRGFPRRT